jgi:hypothetical protein
VVVVSGGGWGVGDLDGAVTELTRIPDATIVCVTGRNEEGRARLAERFAGSDRVRVLGFTDKMAELLAAADVLVHSTGGVTCLEAMARGCPVVSYGLPVGHAKLNTRRMAEHELLALASSTDELVAHVERSRRSEEPRPRLGTSSAVQPDAADVVLRARLRVRPIARWRLRAAHVMTSIVLALGVGIWVMSTDELDAIAAVLSHQVKTVPTNGVDSVFVIVHAQPREMTFVAGELKHAGIEASFASTVVPSSATLARLHYLGDDVIPEIARGSLLHWIHTPAELRREQRRLHLHRHFFYLEPSNPSFGELLLGHVAGGQGVTGAVQFGSPAAGLSRSLREGDVVVVRLDRVAGSTRTIGRVVSALRESRLSGRPLPTRSS